MEEYPPESLFRVTVPPSVSDSAQTPPSPILYSKSRLSRSTTNSTHPSKSRRSNRRSDSHRSGSSTPTPQFKRDRERQLANVPRDTLLQHTITKEYELREAKHLLTTALIQLEAIREKFIHEHDIRLALEDEKKEQAVNSTKTLIDTQQDAMDAKEEVRRFQLHLENSQSELHKIGDVVNQLESDKTDLERELVRARDSARTFKEQNTLLYAREEGRREGFEEGLRQGRAIHGVIDLTQTLQLPPADSSSTKDSNKTSHEKQPPSRHKPNADERHSHSIDTEIELRKIAERDTYRLNLQVSQLSRELDQQRQKTKEVEADRKRLVDELARLKRELRAKNEEIVRLAERSSLLAKQMQTSERKGRDSVARRETRVDELKTQVEKLSTDNERLQKEKDDTERKLKEEIDKAREQKEKDKETIATASSKPSYIRMVLPPIPPNTSGPVPRPTSSGSSSARQQANRPFSVESQSSSTTSAPSEMPQSPANRRGVIDHPGSNANSGPWDPPFPIPQIVPPPQSQSPRVMPRPAPNSQYLQPTGSYLYGYGQLPNGSQSSIEINVEPPSRPPSVDHQEVGSSGAFLSPNHRPASLPPAQDTPLPVLPRIGRNLNSTPVPSPYQYDPSGVATRPNSPVIPGVTVPMPQPPSRNVLMHGPTSVIDGSLPPGFVPQTITDPNGVSTPIWQSGALPSPSVGRPPQLPHPAQAPRSGPIYGNPLNRDREDEDDSYIPFSPYGPGSRPGPGMTPAASPRNLPGPGVIPGANVGPRSGVSIYAPAPPPVMGNNTWGYSPGGINPGPLPHSAPHAEEEDLEDVDSETALNTRLNATMGMRIIPPGQDIGHAPASGYPNWRR